MFVFGGEFQHDDGADDEYHTDDLTAGDDLTQKDGGQQYIEQCFGGAENRSETGTQIFYADGVGEETADIGHGGTESGGQFRFAERCRIGKEGDDAVGKHRKEQSVKVDGKRWSAISDKKIAVGEEVTVLEIDGVKLKVRKGEE